MLPGEGRGGGRSAGLRGWRRWVCPPWGIAGRWSGGNDLPALQRNVGSEGVRSAREIWEIIRGVMRGSVMWANGIQGKFGRCWPETVWTTELFQTKMGVFLRPSYICGLDS